MTKDDGIKTVLERRRLAVSVSCYGPRSNLWKGFRIKKKKFAGMNICALFSSEV